MSHESGPLFSLHILVLCSHTNTHPYSSCSYLKFIDQNIMACLFLLLFLHLYYQKIFRKPVCCVILPPDLFFFISWNESDVMVIPNIFHSLSKPKIVQRLENVLRRIIFDFCSEFCVHIYVRFQPCLLIYSITHWTFSSITSWSNACFRALMCMT